MDRINMVVVTRADVAILITECCANFVAEMVTLSIDVIIDLIYLSQDLITQITQGSP